MTESAPMTTGLSLASQLQMDPKIVCIDDCRTKSRKPTPNPRDPGHTVSHARARQMDHQDLGAILFQSINRAHELPIPMTRLRTPPLNGYTKSTPFLNG